MRNELFKDSTIRHLWSINSFPAAGGAALQAPGRRKWRLPQATAVFAISRMLLAIVFLVVVTHSAAQGRVSVGFYNVENLFDTIDNPFTDDVDFTPAGANRWTGERYRAKISNLARVLDDMSLDVAGLAEVENLDVVQDLIRAMRTDYACVHITGGDSRGMDLALLYKGDKFFPDTGRDAQRLVRSDYGRDFLYVRGKLCGHRVDLIVCHMPSNLNTRRQRETAFKSLYAFADSLRKADPLACPIILGDMNATPASRMLSGNLKTGRSVMDGAAFMFNPFYNLARQGQGSYAYRDRWLMYDNIMLGSPLLGGNGLRYDSCGVFIRDYMLVPPSGKRGGYPLRTYSAGAYLDGYSDHLPVYAYFVF